MAAMNTSFLNAVQGPESEWFWVMCQFVAVAVSLVLILRQVRHMRQANMLQALVSLDARWKSDEFYAYRVSACQRYNDGKMHISRREGEVLSFFEGLGAYLERGVFDREILWDKYSYHIECYWFMFKQHVSEFRSSSRDDSWFERFEYLDQQMKKCASKRRLKNYGQKTQEEMNRFISGETDLAAGLKANSPA
jgi:hypothetical protein